MPNITDAETTFTYSVNDILRLVAAEQSRIQNQHVSTNQCQLRCYSGNTYLPTVTASVRGISSPGSVPEAVVVPKEVVIADR